MGNLHEESGQAVRIRGNYEKQVKARGASSPPDEEHRPAEPTGLQRFFEFQDRGQRGSPCKMHNKMEDLIEGNQK